MQEMTSENSMIEVCVLVSTYNGEKYLREQLDSVIAQERVKCHIIVRDDGSSDSTQKILDEYAANGKIEIAHDISGYRWKYGVGGSFLRLLRYAINEYPQVQFFSFCDQDDVWNWDKLDRAVCALSGLGNRALYFTRKKIVDDELKELRSDYVEYLDNMSDFLSPNYAYGCTMVINKLYADYILSKEIEKWPYLHDISLFKIGICCNFEIVYDKYESMMYRQHMGNAEGVASTDILTRKNIHKVVKRRRRLLSKLAKDIMTEFGDDVSDEYRALLEQVANIDRLENKFKILKYYWIHSERCLKSKIRFTGMVVLNGI